MTGPLVSKSLELPHGYQHFHREWFKSGAANENATYLNCPRAAMDKLKKARSEVYVYTQHEIFLQGNIFHHTRSSPNIEGGLVTYATCKHLMRTYRSVRDWPDMWIVGLNPKHCANNAIFFIGCVKVSFPNNFYLSEFISKHYPRVYDTKRACTNPRGDLYSPLVNLKGRGEDHIYDHRSYREPQNHTRSLEFYKKSPGSKSEREDGKIPKWWRDLEYEIHGKRPPCFILSPCFIFSKPLLWTDLKPGRAALRVKTEALAASLRQG